MHKNEARTDGAMTDGATTDGAVRDGATTDGIQLMILPLSIVSNENAKSTKIGTIYSKTLVISILPFDAQVI